MNEQSGYDQAGSERSSPRLQTPPIESRCVVERRLDYLFFTGVNCVAIISSAATTTAEQRLAHLARADKWFLADGCGAIWAPPFPVWLREPGFWDAGHLYEVEVGPLFTVALIDANGIAAELTQTHRHWRPDRLVCHYRSTDGAELTETRELRPRGRFVSSWTLTNTQGPAFLVAFTAQVSERNGAYRRSEDGRRISWQGSRTARNGGALDLRMSLQAHVDADAACRSAVQRCQSRICHPYWRLSPFTELWDAQAGLIEGEMHPGIDDLGQDWAAISVPIAPDQAHRVCFEMSATLAGAPAVADSRDETDVPSKGHWQRHFDSYPLFTCSDAFMERYFDYRVYGLHLCELHPAGHVRHPAVAEGIEYFHVPISYSGQCHMLETRWSADPAVARGTLLNFLDNQKADGSLHGRIYNTSLERTDFYHANWGDALRAVDCLHPDGAYFDRAYQGLSRYFDWLTSQRDPEQTGTIEVVNHFETGQEYMSRYQAVNATADADGWSSRTRLKGVDTTVYGYQLARALSLAAERLDKSGQQDRFAAVAERMAHAIQEKMWNPQTGLYSDLESDGRTRTNVKAAVCFYPMLTDLPTADQLIAMLDHLDNPAEFATPWPLPSSSMDDPKFDPSARWQGKRHLCPWNGRVWPMTTSHVIEGLIRQWRRTDALPEPVRRRCGNMAGAWIQRFIKMMFHHGDVSRPNCFEHYNPFTGKACEYRGIDDYQHSWVIDLVMTGVMGLAPTRDARGDLTLRVNPLPMQIERAAVSRVRIADREISVLRQGDQFEVTVDGSTHRASIGQAIELDLTRASIGPVILDAGKTPAGLRRKAVADPTALPQ